MSKGLKDLSKLVSSESGGTSPAGKEEQSTRKENISKYYSHLLDKYVLGSKNSGKDTNVMTRVIKQKNMYFGFIGFHFAYPELIICSRTSLP